MPASRTAHVYAQSFSSESRTKTSARCRASLLDTAARTPTSVPRAEAFSSSRDVRRSSAHRWASLRAEVRPFATGNAFEQPLSGREIDESQPSPILSPLIPSSTLPGAGLGKTSPWSRVGSILGGTLKGSSRSTACSNQPPSANTRCGSAGPSLFALRERGHLEDCEKRLASMGGDDEGRRSFGAASVAACAGAR